MSRMHAILSLVTSIGLTACEPIADPAAKTLTAEERAAVGTYTVTLVNGKPIPVFLGYFLPDNFGADVIVNGGTLVLDSQMVGVTGGSAYPARLNVSVTYIERDPISGATRIDTRETAPSWSLSGATFSFRDGNPG